MNIALLGYGKMGKLIGELAEGRGHHIVARINLENQELRNSLDPKTIDVAIEFSQPEAALDNIRWAITNGIPVLSGTTGWLARISEIEDLTHLHQGTFFYASNFSIGVNIFFKVNELLAKLMNETNGYQVALEEIHHTEKKDAPSGTAITLAEGILKHYAQLKAWQSMGETPNNPSSLPITSKRIDSTPGTHRIRYTSGIDDLEITHTAHSRQGFALGAIQVAEWILGKKGVLSIDDYLSF
ncbi:MAG: 4-hydroxy-tetrahydrodipicolinate reductase [Bacteroidetes bacterium]|nr:4-hydroxy-tetrahydrodipicolinate reductase [Bacteroidota bacterium]MDA1269221.1 4-hydroxy-tetrahydrodipicolinate reductase [Bacteroidota bacterium]